MSEGFVFLNVETWDRAERLTKPGLANPVSVALDELEAARARIAELEDIRAYLDERLGARVVELENMGAELKEWRDGTRQNVDDEGDAPSRVKQVAACFRGLESIPFSDVREQAARSGVNLADVEAELRKSYRLDGVRGMWVHSAPEIGGPQWPVATGANPGIELKPPAEQDLSVLDRLCLHVIIAAELNPGVVSVGRSPDEPNTIVVKIDKPITLRQEIAVRGVLREQVPAGVGWMIRGPIAPLPQAKADAAMMTTPAATTKTKCPDCRGSGQYLGAGMYAPEPCRLCGGSGEA